MKKPRKPSGSLQRALQGELFSGPLHVEQCLLLMHLEGKPTVVVGQRRRRHIGHPIIVKRTVGI
jgi:hypothetical protein